MTLVALVGAALACASHDSEVRIEGELTWGECDADLLPWNPPFATYTRTTGEQAIIRLQSGAGPANLHDFFSFQLRDVAALETQLNMPLEVAPPGSDAPVIGIVGFPESCPVEGGISAGLVGTITFSKFRNKQGSTVEGVFEVTVVDAREPDTILGEGIIGEFEFEIRLTQPYQIFSLEAAVEAESPDASVDNPALDAAN